MDSTTIFKVSRQSSVEDRELVLNQVYRRILERQPLKFERLELKAVEQDFLKGKIGVRRFIRHLGASSLYLNEFYYKSSTPKFVEICFQQLMGRPLSSIAEMQFYANILAKHGPAKLVSAVLDTEEYRKDFGCFTVPYCRVKPFYNTPYAYLEGSQQLLESFNQRQQTVSSLISRQLHSLNGPKTQVQSVKLPVVNDVASEDSEAMDIAAMQRQLKEILMTLDRSTAKQVVEKLPTAQLRRLQAILL